MAQLQGRSAGSQGICRASPRHTLQDWPCQPALLSWCRKGCCFYVAVGWQPEEHAEVFVCLCPMSVLLQDLPRCCSCELLRCGGSTELHGTTRHSPLHPPPETHRGKMPKSTTWDVQTSALLCCPQPTQEHGASTGAANWQDRQGAPLRRNITRPTSLSTPKARSHTPPRVAPAPQEGAGPRWVSRSGAGMQGLARTVPPCTALHPACWNLLTGLALGIRALHRVRKIRA